MLNIVIKMTEYCILQVISALRFEIFRKENAFKNIFFVEESVMVRLEKLDKHLCSEERPGKLNYKILIILNFAWIPLSSTEFSYL